MNIYSPATLSLKGTPNASTFTSVFDSLFAAGASELGNTDAVKLPAISQKATAALANYRSCKYHVLQIEAANFVLVRNSSAAKPISYFYRMAEAQSSLIDPALDPSQRARFHALVNMKYQLYSLVYKWTFRAIWFDHLEISSAADEEQKKKMLTTMADFVRLVQQSEKTQASLAKAMQKAGLVVSVPFGFRTEVDTILQTIESAANEIGCVFKYKELMSGKDTISCFECGHKFIPAETIAACPNCGSSF